MFDRWREPREIQATRETKLVTEGGGLGFPPYMVERVEFDRPLPNVIRVTDRALRYWREDISSIEDLGYLELEHDPMWAMRQYVRGRWLWLLHRAGEWLWHRSRDIAWWGVPEDGSPRF